MKSLLAGLLVLVLAPAAFGQVPENRNEVFVAVGDPGLIFAFEDVGTVLFTLGTVRYGDQKGGIQVSAGYQRWLSSWSSLGVSGSWASASKTMYILDEPVADVERRLLTVMADWRAHWLRRPAWDLYSGVAVGLSNYSDDLYSAPDEHGNFPTLNLIPVGVRVGREWGGFGELGIGLNGFVRAGLSHRF